MTRPKTIPKRLIKYIVLSAAGIYASVLSGGYQTVIDGDTIRIGRERIRLEGVDAPETKQTCICNGKTVSCGLLATKELLRLIGADTVVCEPSGRDIYGRLLAECFVTRDGRKISLNEKMVENGMAMAGYSDRFLPQEAEAIRNKRGLWACESFEDPKKFRKRN